MSTSTKQGLKLIISVQVIQTIYNETRVLNFWMNFTSSFECDKESNQDDIVFLEPFFDGTYRSVDFEEIPYNNQICYLFFYRSS